FFLGTMGHQSGILLPVLFFSFFVFLYKLILKYKWRVRKIPSEKLFLLCFFIPVFGGFLLVSFFYWVKLNWMMPAYISGIIWVGAYFNMKWIRIQYIISLILHLVFAYVIIFYPVPVRSDDTWYGWKELAVAVEQIQKQDPNSFIFSVDEYKVSAELGLYLDQDIYAANIIGRPALQYDYIGTNLLTLKGRDAILIQSRPHFKEEGKENDQPPLLNKYFDSVIQLEPILIKKGSKTVRKFLVYRCVNYHPQTTP
ncbi:MAG TPA: hypothetical protein VLJ68_00150, partial [Chitinophagaceae bacterium]|nr:hypothetical protein [Chitinophagaceae bacterium]